jgi:hypothetical protein
LKGEKFRRRLTHLLASHLQDFWVARHLLNIFLFIIWYF